MKKLKVAIVGSGNIGIDLMIEILRHSTYLEMGAMFGIDAGSDGLARAARMGVAITHEGVELNQRYESDAVIADDEHDEVWLRDKGLYLQARPSLVPRSLMSGWWTRTAIGPQPWTSQGKASSP